MSNDINEKRTFKGLLLEMKLSNNYETQILAQENIEEMFTTLELENRELRERLKNAIHFQEKAKSFISHYDDCNSLVDEVPDDECCQCGMDRFAHDNYISIEISKKSLENKGGGNG